MIKINLLGEDAVVENSGQIWLVAYAGSLLLFVGVLFGLYQSVNSQLTELSQKKEGLETEVAKVKEKTKEVAGLEAKRAELNSKLAVIATLKKSKSGPVRILDDLNKALPERAWLVDLSEKGGILSLSGLALDNQTIASFLRTLETSDYYKNVELDETKQVDKGGVKIKAFTLKSLISYSGRFDPAIPAKAPEHGAPPGAPPAPKKKGAKEDAKA